MFAASKKYIEEMNTVYNFFTTNFEKTGKIKDFITLKDIFAGRVPLDLACLQTLDSFLKPFYIIFLKKH